MDLKADLKIESKGNTKSHQELGQELKLFMFNDNSPGSCFFLPHGTRVYNGFLNLMKNIYKKKGYDEVITPVIFKNDLWKTSGHWDNYKENMYVLEEEDFSMKPMNCAGHCLIFNHDTRSYKDLPIRLADFGTLHRNELSGALRGLTRVRKFSQDDAHIFCRRDQIKDEISECLNMLKKVYELFDLDCKFFISTRPTKSLGNEKDWEGATQELIKALELNKIEYEVNDKDGAFYGPKIDILVKDSLDRSHQCGTIQLDFQLPEKFDLSYVKDDGSKEKPVIIHRAIYGSIERFMAIILEHTQGKLPIFVSPRQVSIIPINNKVEDYALKVKNKLLDKFDYVDIDNSDLTIKNKIRLAETMKYNFILVVGNREKDNNSINLRTDKGGIEMKLDEFIRN